jgi:uncharacterized membrane protein YfcA
MALKLEPQIAIGSALITELFGFSSGLVAYLKARLIDFKLATNILIFSVPAAIIGTLFGDLVPDIVLKSIFASGLLFIGIQLFTSWRKEEREKQKRKANIHWFCTGNQQRFSKCRKKIRGKEF